MRVLDAPGMQVPHKVHDPERFFEEQRPLLVARVRTRPLLLGRGRGRSVRLSDLPPHRRIRCSPCGARLALCSRNTLQHSHDPAAHDDA